jgi:hypothetical protein
VDTVDRGLSRAGVFLSGVSPSDSKKMKEENAWEREL